MTDDFVHKAFELTSKHNAHMQDEVKLLIADVIRLKKINAELVEALRLLTVTCENVHHPKKDRHSIEVECPVVARINALKAQGENNATDQ